MGLNANVYIDDKNMLWESTWQIPHITQILDFPRTRLLHFIYDRANNPLDHKVNILLYDDTKVELDKYNVYKFTPEELRTLLEDFPEWLEQEEEELTDSREIFMLNVFKYMPEYYRIYIQFH